MENIYICAASYELVKIIDEMMCDFVYLLIIYEVFINKYFAFMPILACPSIKTSKILMVHIDHPR